MSNEPSVLPERTFEVLNQIAGRTFRGCDGVMRPLLTAEEVRLLSIRKGSLDAERARGSGIARGAQLQLPQADSMDAGRSATFRRLRAATTKK